MEKDQERKLEDAIRYGAIKRGAWEKLPPEEREDLDRVIERHRTPTPEQLLAYEEMEMQTAREAMREDSRLTPEERQEDEAYIEAELKKLAARRRQLGIAPQAAETEAMEKGRPPGIVKLTHREALIRYRGRGTAPHSFLTPPLLCR
jgi:hypothetical protein